MIDAGARETTAPQHVDPNRVAWHISTRSPDTHGSCVEAGPVADGSGRVAVRHSHQPTGHILIYERHDWHAFTTAIKTGKLNI